MLSIYFHLMCAYLIYAHDIHFRIVVMTIGSLLPAGFLSTNGNQIVDAAGNDVRIASIGWNENFSDIPDSVAEIAAAGFNTIRVSWVDATLSTDLPQLEAIVAAATANGIKVIIDHHTDEAGTAADGYGAQQANGLWFDSGPGTDGTNGAGVTGTVTAAKFLADWKVVATAFAGNSTVIGFNPDNEPTSAGNINWGQGGPTDILAEWELVGNAIEAIDPGVLFVPEGPIEYNPPPTGSGMSSTVSAPEGDLTGAVTDPVVLTIPNKVVYSVHEYPSTISGTTIGTGAAYIQQMNQAWGFVETQNIAPVIIGEMGASLDGTSESAGAGLAVEQAWATTLVAYMNGQDGAQGGPTFTGAQQGVASDWWNWGYNPGQQPDGIVNADGSLNSAQQAIWSQLLYHAASTTPTPTPAPTATPTPTGAPSANDTVVLAGSSAAITDASGNAWTITSGGQVAVNGTADATTANVTELAYVNGTIWQENAASLWWGETAPNSAWSPAAGTATSPLPVTIADTLVLQLSEDAYQGDAEFTISVNGVQVEDTQAIVASHGDGHDTTVMLNGLYGNDPTVVVHFVNDAYGGKGLDRNLYIDGITYDGVAQMAAASLYTDGPVAFALHGVVQFPVAPNATLSLTNDIGTTTNLAVIASGSMTTFASSQIDLDGSIYQSIDSTGVANISTDPLGSGVVAVSAQDTSGASYHFSNFVSTNVELAGAKAGSLTIDGSAGGNVTLGSGNYDVSIAAEADLAGSATQSQFTVTLGGNGNYALLIDDGATDGTSSNIVHAAAGTNAIAFIAAQSSTVYGGAGVTMVTSTTGTNSFIAGTGTLDVQGGSGADAYRFAAGDGLLNIADFTLLKGDTLSVDQSLSNTMTQTSDGHGGLMIGLGSAGHGVDLAGVTALPANAIHFV